MKNKATLFLLLFITSCLFAQNIKKIDNLKDAWDLSYNYTGEVKDGKPNGMGVATYTSGTVTRYAGNFVNGFYSGKGTMFFKEGSFLTGEWKSGKLNGKGSNLTGSGSLYIGDFADGVKSGKGILFYKDNSVICGNYSNDKMNGRCIQIWTDGSIVSDIFYKDDKRNGLGYQYEVKTKKLYTGEWKDDKWLQAGTPSFSSFLSNTSFVGEMTAEHILMGPTNSSHFLIDSSYYYDLSKYKRYFGKYENGKLRNGFIIRDDSTRFLGPLNDKGANGYCYDFKTGKYYSEGLYLDDYLNGKILDIDLEKKTVYYGDALAGAYTGKANFINDKGTMYSGDYEKGKFTGNGYKLETNGRYTLGTWQDGKIIKLTSVISPKGELISGSPKTFAEGLNSVIKSYPEIFDNIYGDAVTDTDVLTSMEEIDPDTDLEFTNSYINIPGSIDKNVIAEDFEDNTFYYARFLKTDNATKAKAKYNELATQLQAAIITNAFLTGKQKLTGKLVAPDLSSDKTETEFTLSGSSSEFENFHVWLRIRKNDNDDYVVEILIGEKSEDF